MSEENHETPRGIRNNNPGNIEHMSGVKWLGQTGQDSDGYLTFKSAAYGIRAAMVLVRDYHYMHGCNSIGAVISRWAPGPDNPTQDYIDYVSRRCDVSPWQTVDFCSIAVPMAQAMCTFENGTDPYTPAEYERAQQLAHLK